MYYIFGLGNPGLKYRKTRHNAGYLAVDELAARCGIKLRPTKFDALLGQGFIDTQRVTLVKPTTFMNNSGYAVSAVMDYYDADNSQMIVLYDDIDLPLGTLRIREKGGAGTHNGMRSIVEYLGADDFLRVRIGIGKPDVSLTGYVLGKFPKEDEARVKEAVSRAADACETIVTQGVRAAQESCQRPPEEKAGP